MTERPRTMMLSPYEWRSLVIASATNLYQYTNTVTAVELPPSGAQVQWLHDTLDRLKMQVSAWQASGQPAVQTEKEQMNEAYRETDLALRQAIGNGSGITAVPAGPKKKRGWQKGRKRGPRKPRTDEAVQ